MTSLPRLVLVHGTATTAATWDRVAALLGDYDVVAPERPRTGSLTAEVDWLASLAEGSWVVGASGGATLGLALAATGARLAGAVLHEPAVGSLVPELLDPVAEAFARSGTAGLGAALYGPSWSVELAGGQSDSVTARELAMFRSFEPAAVSAAAGRVVVSHGSLSPPVRRRAAAALAPLGCEPVELVGAGHFASYDAPSALAELVIGVVSGAQRPPR